MTAAAPTSSVAPTPGAHHTTLSPPFSSSSSFELTRAHQVRDWLQQHHRKTFALLEQFLLELRQGRLERRRGSSSSTAAPEETDETSPYYHYPSSSVSSSRPDDNNDHHHHNNNNNNNNNLMMMLDPQRDRLWLTWQTLDVLRHVVGSTSWKSAAQVLMLLRGLGHEFSAAVGGPRREPALGNLVRRVMAAVREEVQREEESSLQQQQHVVHHAATATSSSAAPAADGGRWSLNSLLWALPQHVKSRPYYTSTTTSSSSSMISADHQRQESSAASSLAATRPEDDEDPHHGPRPAFPATYHVPRPDLKPVLMEAMQEIMTELEDLHKNINEQALQHIHSGDVIYTWGRDRTVELFLKAAAAKKRQFRVLVGEGAGAGPGLARALRAAGVETTLLHDAAVWAVMSRVNKVLLPAQAVLANGGLVTHSGGNLVALAAQQASVPVVCVTGLYKLTPLYPHEGQDTLNDLISPQVAVWDYSDLHNDPLLAPVEVLHPVHDYVPPEQINLYITNVGTFQPSFTYRLLAEYYHSDDWASF